MWTYFIAIALVGGLTLSPLPASGKAGDSPSDVAAVNSTSENMTVIGVALAENVKDREPVGSVNPSVSCRNNGQSQDAIPVVDSSVSGQVFFWNTVQSSTDSTLRHIWLMKRGQGWQPMAQVDLPIGKSHAYRTWSSKKFDRSQHLGEWRIEVAEADQPDKVLCQSSFQVR